MCPILGWLKNSCVCDEFITYFISLSTVFVLKVRTLLKRLLLLTVINTLIFIFSWTTSATDDDTNIYKLLMLFCLNRLVELITYIYIYRYKKTITTYLQLLITKYTYLGFIHIVILCLLPHMTIAYFTLSFKPPPFFISFVPFPHAPSDIG